MNTNMFSQQCIYRKMFSEMDEFLMLQVLSEQNMGMISLKTQAIVLMEKPGARSKAESKGTFDALDCLCFIFPVLLWPMLRSFALY